MNIFDGLTCDKLFIIPKVSDPSVIGKIIYEQNKEDPLAYTFRINNQTIKNGEITRYEWKINNTTASTDESFTHHFPAYGDVRVLLSLGDSAGNTTELSENFAIRPPLKLTKGSEAESLLKVTDSK